MLRRWGVARTPRAVALCVVSRSVFTSIASAAATMTRRERRNATAAASHNNNNDKSSNSSRRGSDAAATAMASSSTQRVHALSTDMTAAYDDSGVNASGADAMTTPYSRGRYNAFVLLYGRRLWLPVLFAVGYSVGVVPLLAALPWLSTSTSWWCSGLYASMCVLLQRLAIRGRTCAVWRARDGRRRRSRGGGDDIKASGDTHGASYLDMRDRVCVVTGATSGVGLYTAAQLLDLGARVVVAARPGKEAATMRFFAEHCRNSNDNNNSTAASSSSSTTAPLARRVSFVPVDFADPLSILAAAAQVKAQHDNRIDVLVNCAAMRRTTASRLPSYDVEAHVAVDFLGPFHLTEALLPALRRARGRPGRVVYVTCATHGAVRGGSHEAVLSQLKLLPPPTMPSEVTDDIAHRCRAAAKLGNIYHAQSIATRPCDDKDGDKSSNSSSNEETGRVEACCADPGWVAADGVTPAVLRALWAKTPYEASQTVLHCCVCASLQPAGYYYECTHMPGGLSRCAHRAHTREVVVCWALAKTIAKYYKARAN